MEIPKEKAIDLLSKINNQEITPKIWHEASEYAKKDLRRKAHIVVSEVLLVLSNIEYTKDGTKAYTFYADVQNELNKL